MNARRIAILAGLGLLTLTPRSPAVGPLQFYSITPCRLVDTRGPVGQNGGPALLHAQVRNFRVRGLCGIPSSAPLPQAAVLNAVIIGPTGTGYFTMYQYGATPPPTSNINFNAGEPALANGTLVALHPTDATLHFSAFAALADAGSAHLVVDVVGYYQ